MSSQVHLLWKPSASFQRFDEICLVNMYIILLELDKVQNKDKDVWKWIIYWKYK